MSSLVEAHSANATPLSVRIVLVVPPESANKRVTLPLRHVPLIEALREVTGQSDLKVVVEFCTAYVVAKDQ